MESHADSATALAAIAQLISSFLIDVSLLTTFPAACRHITHCIRLRASSSGPLVTSCLRPLRVSRRALHASPPLHRAWRRARRSLRRPSSCRLSRQPWLAYASLLLLSCTRSCPC